MKLKTGSNRIIFLLVKSDLKTPVDNLDGSGVVMHLSINGGAFERINAPAIAMGNGWFRVDVDLQSLPPLTPVAFIADLEGSPQWRDMGHVDNTDERLGRIERTLAIMAGVRVVTLYGDSILAGAPTVPQVRAVQRHALNGDSILVGTPVLSAGAIAQIYSLNGDPLTAGIPYIRGGNVGVADDLLTPGESLGVNLLGDAWGAYDNTHTMQIVDQSPAGITINLKEVGNNQQVWKLAGGLEPCDYILQFELNASAGGGVAVYVRLHGSPYTILGFGETIEANGVIRRRFSSPGANSTVRLQFLFSGLHHTPETYTLQKVSLRKVEV